MSSKSFKGSQFMLVGIGFVSGAVLVVIDNFAFRGEVSPIVIVALLVVVTAASGIIWGWRGWIVAVFTWACVPLAHLIKHLLGLPDTLNPNTYTSILMLAIFTLVVSIIGIVSGVFLRRVTKFITKSNS